MKQKDFYYSTLYIYDKTLNDALTADFARNGERSKSKYLTNLIALGLTAKKQRAELSDRDKTEDLYEKLSLIDKRERKVQTAEEYKAIPPELRKDFVKALDTSPILKPICYTSLFVGLRIGEVLALRWRDIDFTDKTIWVDNAVTVIPHYGADGEVTERETVISDTKTAASVRSVPMPQVFIDCLKEHRKRRRNMEYDTCISFTDDDDLVFSNEEGELRTYYGTRAMFNKLMKKVGFDEFGFHFHTLRHTYSSMLFESGENPKVIQMLLGHKDVTTTIRTYNSVD